nr:ras GTPase-activating protein-binding protein 1-like isoform X2 [Onthophagus taurus]
MRLSFFFLCFITILYKTTAQVPPRLAIPGAVLVTSQQSRPVQSRPRPSQQTFQDIPIRRKTSFNAIPSPTRETRPVIEESEDIPQPFSSTFEAEVAKLGLSSLQSGIGQAVSSAEEEEEEEPQRAVAFRPERPVPVSREDIRAPSRPAPLPQQRPVQIAQQRPATPTRQAPLFRESIVNVRQQIRQESRDEEENIPIRRPQPIRPSITQEYRAPVRAQPLPVRQQVQYEDEDPKRNKNRKPPVQILRKYRTDNEDGSITWGYENEDGTFKEETIGIDCIVRGKYGYTDPEGTRREYTYEAGGVCDEPEEELILQEPGQSIRAQPPPKGGKKLYRLPV